MKTLLASAAALAFTLAASSAFAQAGPSSTASATASAEIVTPISITNVTGLDFGRIAAPSATMGAATVTVDVNGDVTSAPGVVIAGSNSSAATFTVAGQGGLAYNVSVPATTTLGGLTATLLLDGAAGRSLNAAGAGAITVSGSLAVPVGTSAGLKSGSFDVSVQYQ